MLGKSSFGRTWSEPPNGSLCVPDVNRQGAKARVR